ncbi:hypothetical protein ElyMa_001771800 [Elysia marginata]|uniref:Uncharacterized protein n=1 Tax=Elysia marginata TaxID=1093978 RepID=A0AAV4EDH8_9GAST|nr:hypothetical protein ElyMa_001771800 [Elysia marginata]
MSDTFRLRRRPRPGRLITYSGAGASRANISQRVCSQAWPDFVRNRSKAAEHAQCFNVCPGPHSPHRPGWLAGNHWQQQLQQQQKQRKQTRHRQTRDLLNVLRSGSTVSIDL